MKRGKTKFNEGDCWDEILSDIANDLEKAAAEQNALVRNLDKSCNKAAFDQLYSLVVLQLKLINDLKTLERVLTINHSIYTICQN